uniref:Uncharacterized protein n=1 Tax=Solanum lycopersicum TaxID=4081 RepID=A0A3Q7FAI0_SOLLC
TKTLSSLRMRDKGEEIFQPTEECTLLPSTTLLKDVST